MKQAVRDALIAFMAASAQAQAEATKEAQRAGIEAARLNGNRYKGRKPSYNRAEFQAVTNMVGHGIGASEVAKATRLTRQTVLRIKADPAKAQAALEAWGL